ncbi:tyrosine/serine/threonine protein phosphatase pps1 [Actinomortierella wolfii]|nr:tyrosine/serine/threonine protein phosphatase pps1 [Actinomortierella wolfii]
MMATVAIESDGYSTLAETPPSQTPHAPSTLPAKMTPLKHISARDLRTLHRAYIETPLPSGTLFPWLHGVDGHNPLQNTFFEIDSMAGGLPIPSHRGLLFVHASDLSNGRLVGSISPSELLEPVPAPACQNVVHPNQSSPSRAPTPSSSDIDAAAAEQAPLTDAVDNATTVDMDCVQACPITPNGDMNMASADSSADSSLLLSDDSLSFESTSSANAQALAASLTPFDASNSATTSLQPRFLSTESDGINIRNFKVQVARYATISNIIVYGSAPTQPSAASSLWPSDCPRSKSSCSEGDESSQEGQEWFEQVLRVAKLISDAQEDFFVRMQPFGMQQRCETMVVTEPFQCFEQICPELIAVDATGRPTQHNVDFWELEREKMTLLTRASEIAPGVWLGNHADVPNDRSSARLLATPISPGPEHSSYFASDPSLPPSELYPVDKPSTPPNDYPPLIPPLSTITTSAPQPSVCIQCRSGAIAPSSATLEFVRSSVRSASAPLPTNEIFHLECSGSLTSCVEPSLFPPSTSSLNNHTGMVVQEKTKTALPSPEEISAMHAARRSMAAHIAQGSECGHAILRTQISQLVDMTLFVEQLVSEQPMQPSQRRHQVLLHCVDGYTDTSLLALSYIMLHYKLSLAEAYVKLQVDLGRSFFVYPNDALMMLQVEEIIWDTILKRQEANGLTTTTDSGCAEDGNTTMETNENADQRTTWMMKPFHQIEHELQYGWLYHYEFEGSFPSRILPFLYLGDLAHASNPGLLEALGIRHILSVGEATGLGDPSDGTGLNVMLVDDMYDNGIHSLWNHLEQCVEYIESARKSQSRVLIHCRVGVSRSATIVIAYLMAYYRLSLVEAYLTVRARRLSVIIQPNLLFMYELLQWDQRLRGRFDALGWAGITREIHNLNMYYFG